MSNTFKWFWMMEYCKNSRLPTTPSWAWDRAEQAYEDHSNMVTAKNDMYTKLYLDYLGSTIDSPRGKQQVVKHPKNWERIESIIQHDRDHIINPPNTKLNHNNWYIWSDQHFSHANIIKYCDRPFKDIHEMDATLVTNYNNVVSDDDICIWVGDVGFAVTTKINELLDECNGYKILIAGNHDFSKKNLRGLHFDEIHMLHHFMLNGVNYLLTHYPIPNLPPNTKNIHGHIHNTKSPSSNHINVCVEMLEYKPILLSELLNE